MLRAMLYGVLLASSLAGCHRDEVVRCEDSARYLGSASIPPVRVPDGLTPPNESESLVIPPRPAPVSASPLAGDRCLESPPPYFDEGTPGSVAPVSSP